MSDGESVAGDAGGVIETASEDASSARTLHAGSGNFWMCGEGVHALDNPTPFGQENALQRLGKPPFEKSTRSRFRLLGYLATVYEHVSRDVGNATQTERPRDMGGDGASVPATR